MHMTILDCMSMADVKVIMRWLNLLFDIVLSMSTAPAMPEYAIRGSSRHFDRESRSPASPNTCGINPVLAAMFQSYLTTPVVRVA